MLHSLAIALPNEHFFFQQTFGVLHEPVSDIGKIALLVQESVDYVEKSETLPPGSLQPSSEWTQNPMRYVLASPCPITVQGGVNLLCGCKVL